MTLWLVETLVVPEYSLGLCGSLNEEQSVDELLPIGKQIKHASNWLILIQARDLRVSIWVFVESKEKLYHRQFDQRYG